MSEGPILYPSVQYQLVKPRASFIRVFVLHPVPKPNEICIRTRAVALNPLDWKQRLSGMMVQSWPAVLGIDAAGIVDSVGDSVTDFVPGDEVFSLCGMGNRAGAFQEVITVPSHFAAKKPAFLTFEEATSLPTCYLTATSAISRGLHLPLPDLGVTSNESLNSVLVLGGSSTTGATAIQLLRLALPLATILTTSSAKHHTHLISLGATACFERSAQDNPSDIRAATAGSFGVDAILDAVTAAADQPAVLTALNPTGPKLYSYIVTGQHVAVPEGLHSTAIFAREIFEMEGGRTAMSGLASLLEGGKFRLPVKIAVLGKGLDNLDDGLERLKQGVSGAKYVISM